MTLMEIEERRKKSVKQIKIKSYIFLGLSLISFLVSMFVMKYLGKNTAISEYFFFVVLLFILLTVIFLSFRDENDDYIKELEEEAIKRYSQILRYFYMQEYLKENGCYYDKDKFVNLHDIKVSGLIKTEITNGNDLIMGNFGKTTFVIMTKKQI